MKVRNYEGYEITLEDTGNFNVTIDGIETSKDTLREILDIVDKHVDRITKTKKAQVPKLSILIGDSCSKGSFKRGSITSCAGMHKGYNDPYYTYWFSVNGRRSKDRAYNVYEDTPENIERFNKIKELKNEIETTEKALTKPDLSSFRKAIGLE
jgi:hypothetical protein